MEIPSESYEKQAPPGAIFLSAVEISAFLGDYGMQRAVRLMYMSEVPLEAKGDAAAIVEAVIREAAQEPPHPEASA